MVTPTPGAAVPCGKTKGAAGFTSAASTLAPTILQTAG